MAKIVKIMGEDLVSHSPFAFFFFFKVEISLHAPIPFFLGQDQSTVAQQAEMTVDKHSLMSCVCACSLPDSHTMPGYHSQPTPTLFQDRCSTGTQCSLSSSFPILQNFSPHQCLSGDKSNNDR